MFKKNQETLFSYELSKGINLFLGAGFSVLPNSLNEKFPTARELCDEICKEFNIDELFRDDLYSASEMIPESEYQFFLRNRFTVNGDINPKYYLLDKLNIKNIITTNIDNIVPIIYDPDNSLHYINDRSLYGAAHKNSNCIEYIPLNGSVCNVNSHLYFGKFELTLTERKNEDLYKTAYALLTQIPVLFWGYSFSDNGVLLCQEKSQAKQTKSYQPTRASKEEAELLYKFSKSTGERKSQ